MLDEMATRGRPGTGGAEAVTSANDARHCRAASGESRHPRSPNQSPAQYQALLAAARREKEAAERALAENSADERADLSRAALGIKMYSVRFLPIRL